MIEVKRDSLREKVLVFLHTREWVTTPEIIQACGSGLKNPRTSVHELLHRLKREGVVDGFVRAGIPKPTKKPRVGAKRVALWSLRSKSWMGLEDAKNRIREGASFGEVFPLVLESDRLALKGWYCQDTATF